MRTFIYILVILLSLCIGHYSQTPGSVQYPGGIDNLNSLFDVRNNAQTTLSANVTSTATTISVASTSLFPSTGSFSVDNEIIFYTGKTPTSFTGCLRGQDGTTAATHTSAAAVRMNIIARHITSLRDAIIGLENKLGTNTTKTFTLGSSVPLDGNYFSLQVSSTGNKPALRYNGNTNAWEYSNDGTNYSGFGGSTQINGITSGNHSIAFDAAPTGNTGGGVVTSTLESGNATHSLQLSDASTLARGLVNTGAQDWIGTKRLYVRPNSEGLILKSQTSGDVNTMLKVERYNSSTPRFAVDDLGDITHIHGVGYRWPSVYGESDGVDVLTHNGSGVLQWTRPLIEVKNEGTRLGDFKSINFVGGTVDATTDGAGNATITVSAGAGGAGGDLAVVEPGGTSVTAVTQLQFDGASGFDVMDMGSNISKVRLVNVPYTKLALTGSLVNADIASNAGIAFSKMASLATNKAVVTDGSGKLVASSVADTDLQNALKLRGVTISTTAPTDGQVLAFSSSLNQYVPSSTAGGGSGSGGVPSTRQIICGNGLIGCGDFTADRTMAVDTGATLTTGTLDVNQAYAFNWTNQSTYNRGTTPNTAILFDIAAPTVNNTLRDSHNLIMRGRARNGSGVNTSVDWRQQVYIANSAGESSWQLGTRTNSNTFLDVFSVNNFGDVNFGGFLFAGSSVTRLTNATGTLRPEAFAPANKSGIGTTLVTTTGTRTAGQCTAWDANLDLVSVACGSGGGGGLAGSGASGTVGVFDNAGGVIGSSALTYATSTGVLASNVNFAGSNGVTVQNLNTGTGAFTGYRATSNAGEAAFLATGTATSGTGLNGANRLILQASSGLSAGITINTLGTGSPVMFGVGNTERGRFNANGLLVTSASNGSSGLYFANFSSTNSSPSTATVMLCVDAAGQLVRCSASAGGGGGGVTSITGTANQVIASASTGAVTLSLPQSIATTSNVTFNNVTADGQINLGSAGAKKITTTGNELVLEQTGDTFGTSRLKLVARPGSIGALFEGTALNLVDFGFKENGGLQNNLRFEARSEQRLANNTTGQFEMFRIGTPPDFEKYAVFGTAQSSIKGTMRIGGGAVGASSGPQLEVLSATTTQAALAVQAAAGTAGTQAVLSVQDGGGVEKTKILANGALSFVGTTTGSASSPTLAFSDNGQTGFYSHLAGSFSFGGTNRGVQILHQPSGVFNLGYSPRIGMTNGAANGTIDLWLGYRSGANLVQGASDVNGTPVEQRSSVQNAITGTNLAGAIRHFDGSRGTGTGAGGAINFNVAPAGSSGTAQNALVTTLSLATTGATVTAPTATTPALDARAATGAAGSQKTLRVLDASGTETFSVTADGVLSATSSNISPTWDFLSPAAANLDINNGTYTTKFTQTTGNWTLLFTGATSTNNLFAVNATSNNAGDTGYAIYSNLSGASTGIKPIQLRARNATILDSTATGELTVSKTFKANNADFYADTNGKGLILKSPDGTCYRLTVANGGATSTASITCP